jgi:hypothetical protein
MMPIPSATDQPGRNRRVSINDPGTGADTLNPCVVAAAATCATSTTAVVSSTSPDRVNGLEGTGRIIPPTLARGKAPAWVIGSGSRTRAPRTRAVADRLVLAVVIEVDQESLPAVGAFLMRLVVTGDW